MNDYPVRAGSMLFTLVDPSRGHEVAYNRWYERDHFYAGCMVGPWLFAGSRWVAPRRLKDLRLSDGRGEVAEIMNRSLCAAENGIGLLRWLGDGERCAIVLDGFDELKICTGYELDGETLDYLPTAADQQARVTPIYETMPGWSASTAGARSWADLPATAIKYIRRIEELIGVPVALLSTSPERDDTILVKDPFST